jgi:FtsZ-interacting cell division protein YlmF
MHSDTPAVSPAIPAVFTAAAQTCAGREQLGSGAMHRPGGATGCGNRVLVFTPRSFHDARRVIEAVRAQQTVIVNSAWLEDSPGQRLIDFVCGGIAAMCGQVHRVAEEVFLFAPAAVRVQGPAEGDLARSASHPRH